MALAGVGLAAAFWASLGMAQLPTSRELFGYAAPLEPSLVCHSAGGVWTAGVRRPSRCSVTPVPVAGFGGTTEVEFCRTHESLCRVSMRIEGPEVLTALGPVRTALGFDGSASPREAATTAEGMRSCMDGQLAPGPILQLSRTTLRIDPAVPWRLLLTVQCTTRGPELLVSYARESGHR